MIERRGGTRASFVSALLLLSSACSGEDPASDEIGESESSDSESSDSESTGSDSTDSDSTDSSDTDDPPRPERLVVTADWRAKRISLLDYAALRDGATTRDEALWRELDMSAWEPGPLELELTPDGNAALVTVAPGFFTGVVGNLVGAGTVPPGGTLLLIELETGAVIHEFAPMATPLGMAISSDGSTAWTANYGGNGQEGSTVAKLDLVDGTIELELEVGGLPHQIDLSADGSLAILGTAVEGWVRVFGTADPQASLSTPLTTSEDTSWAVLLDDGSGRAFVANSLSPSSYSVIDASDPSGPTLVETVMVSGIPYAARAIGDGTRMLMTTAELDGRLHLFEIDLSVEPSEIVRDIEMPVAGFPLGFAYDETDELALIPAPGDDALVVVDLGDESWRAIPWQNVTGPTYVVLEP